MGCVIPSTLCVRGAEHAVMKSYTLRGEENKEDKFIAYMLPTDTPERGAGAASTSRCLAAPHADQTFLPLPMFLSSDARTRTVHVRSPATACLRAGALLPAAAWAGCMPSVTSVAWQCE